MPQTRTAALNTHMAGSALTLAKCIKITLQTHQPEIVAITNANPGVVTVRWNHRWATGDRVRLVMVRGMMKVNNNEYTITKVDDRRFSIDADTSTFTTYEFGGEVRRIIGYTTYFKGLTFEGVTYNASRAFLPGASRAADDLSVSNTTIEGIMADAALAWSESDVRRGLYFNARIEYFLVNYKDLTQGRQWLHPSISYIGQIELFRNSYKAELRGIEHFLVQNIGSVYSPTCRADLGRSPSASEPRQKDLNFCKVRVEPPEWRPTTVYAVREDGDAGTGSVVRPSVQTGRHFKCIVAGTSGAVEPAWPLAVGATIVDGTVTWRSIEALTRLTSITAIAGGEARFRFTVGPEATTDEKFYQFGTVRAITGSNIGMVFNIKADSASPNKVIELFDDAPFDFVVGDILFLTAGDDKTMETCRDKFDNIHNFRGEPYTPQSQILETPE